MSVTETLKRGLPPRVDESCVIGAIGESSWRNQPFSTGTGVDNIGINCELVKNASCELEVA